jgi:membrane protein
VIRPVGLLWRALRRFFDHNGPDRAAAVALYALLSLLPMLIFLISLGVAVRGSFDAAFQGTLYLFGGVVVHLDPKSLEALRGFVERAVSLRWPGLLLLAWTGRRFFMSLFGALDNVFELPPRGVLRGIAHGNLLALAMVVVVSLGLFATMTFTTLMATTQGLLARVAGPVGAEAFHGFSGLVLGHVVPWLITFSFFFLVYRWVPRAVVTTRQAAAGAALATVLWELAKAGFAWYVRTLAHYAGLYGALEAVIVLALWLELSVSVVLFGGEFVAVLLGFPRPAPPAGRP